MNIPRYLTQIVKNKLLASSKGVIIYGARQVGKTTLVNEIINQLKFRVLTINGDQSRYQDILSSRDLGKIRSLVEGYQMLFIDEAQRIPEIGINLKIILDNLTSLKVVVTGSSSLDLASKISEPLTGRVWNYQLYPISFLELKKIYNPAELNRQLEDKLVFGSYPALFSLINNQEKVEYLQNLSDSYPYKDLLEFGGIKNSFKIRDLLKLLAFQIGSQVSLSEIGSKLGISKDTVSRYIDLLEKSFVIFRLKGFSKNLRKEVSKMDKIYFYDLGVRNVLIDNLKPLKDRDDLGRLWENFLVVERIKHSSYTQDFASIYFWRTYTGAELDYVEQKGGNLFGYEFKYRSNKAKFPLGWRTAYPNSQYDLINQENYLKFIT